MADSVDAITGKLGQFILEEAKLIGVREEVKYIRDELSIMNAFLHGDDDNDDDDAGGGSRRSKIKAEWVKRMTELAFEAEDCVDQFKLRLNNPRQKGLTGRLRFTARYLMRLRARMSIGDEIRRIKSDVKEASHCYGFPYVNPIATTYPRCDTRLGPPLNADPVGREKPRDMLIGWLLEKGSRLDVISVVGTGGLGKTTLAKKVYDSLAVKDSHFDCLIWTIVSQSFSRKNFLMRIFEKCKGSEEHISDEKILAEKIIDYLKDRRYLIVLDDIWTVQAWQGIKPVFPDSGNGSKILMTTRNTNVAKACSSLREHIFHLQPLSLEHSRILLHRKVFGPDHEPPECLDDLTEKILRKCNGIPLAIEAIGGVLATKQDKDSPIEWQQLLDHLGSELETNQTLGEMNRMLDRSFKDLPQHLRKCFLYLSLLPEGCVIDSMRLKRLWMAEGFVEEKRDMSAESVADSYLNELICRSLIEPHSINVFGKAESCRVPNIASEFIVSKSREENLLHQFREDITPLTQHNVRRLSVYATSELEDILDKINLPPLRTLIIFGNMQHPFLTPNLKLLRVLDLESCETMQYDNLSVLCEFHYLKYLSLVDTRIGKLPKSLGKLVNLETLDLRSCDIEEMPDGVNKLKNLCYLLVNHCGDETKFPEGVDNLKNLLEFTGVDLDKSIHMRKELSQLTKLRRLGVSFTKKETAEDFCLSLSKLSKCLRSLTLHTVWSLNHLDSLSSPPLLLESMVLDGPMARLPPWVSSLTNLATLTISETYIKDDTVIQGLQVLPNLLKLVFRDVCFANGSLSVGGEGFQRLKHFVLAGLNLKSLKFEKGAMPKVQNLWLFDAFGEKDYVLDIKHLTGLIGAVIKERPAEVEMINRDLI